MCSNLIFKNHPQHKFWVLTVFITNDIKVSPVGLQYMISLLCFLPHTTLHALQSVPRLYTGNGQVKTQITYSTSLVLGHHLLHLPFIHLPSLFTFTQVSMHDTFSFWVSLVKNRMLETYLNCWRHAIKETVIWWMSYFPSMPLKSHLTSVFSSFSQKALFLFLTLWICCEASV